MYTMPKRPRIDDNARAEMERWGCRWGKYYDLAAMAEVRTHDAPFERIDEDEHGLGTFRLAEKNPVGRDANGDFIYAYPSISQIPRNYFANPTFSALLPPFSRRVAVAAKSRAVMPILLKRSVVLRNTRERHREIPVGENARILGGAIYDANYVMYDKPIERPRYYVCAQRGNIIRRATLDFIKSDGRIEVVDWYLTSVDEFNAELMKAGRIPGAYWQIVKAPVE